MSERLWIGVDLGLEGAIAFVRGDQVDVVDMPVITFKRNGATRRRLSHRGIVEAFHRRELLDGSPNFATFEAVHARPATPDRPGGSKAMFSLGHADGTFQGILTALGIPYRTVTPQAWKKHYGLQGADKNASRLEAQRRFPGLDVSLKKHHGRAEAALLAAFGRHLEIRGELEEIDTP